MEGSNRQKRRSNRDYKGSRSNRRANKRLEEKWDIYRRIVDYRSKHYVSESQAHEPGALKGW